MRSATRATQTRRLNDEPPTEAGMHWIWYYDLDFWGRSASTWAAKLQGRAEVQATSLIRLQTIVANDDNYALAA